MRRIGTATTIAAAALLALTACGSQATEPTASPTVTVAPPPVTTSAPVPTSAAPTGSASPDDSATDGPAPSTTAAADPGRPSGQCADSDLGVAIAPADGGGTAGSRVLNVILTNTGGERCVLRGTPGVSVVGTGGRQIGAAATRDQQDVRTVALGVGESVAAPLRVVDIADGGGALGAACTVQRGTGYRVYPPHSTRAFVVEDADAVACASGRAFMTVRPVIPFTG